MTTTGSSPTTQPSCPGGKLTKSPALEMISVPSGNLVPNVPEMTMVWSPATTAVTTILRGADPKAALDQAQKQVEKDVANLRKK